MWVPTKNATVTYGIVQLASWMPTKMRMHYRPRNWAMKTFSSIHENDVAGMLHKHGFAAVVQPGSGNQAHNPNDVKVRDANLMIECKMTRARTILFKQAWLARVIDKARQF